MLANIILHYSKSAEYNDDKFLKIIRSVLDQTNKDFELTIINNKDTDDILKRIYAINSNLIKVSVVSAKDEIQSEQLNDILKDNNSQFQLYLDNRNQEIFLKKSALELFLLAVKNNKKTG